MDDLSSRLSRWHVWWVESTLRELLKGVLPDRWFDEGPL